MYRPGHHFKILSLIEDMEKDFRKENLKKEDYRHFLVRLNSGFDQIDDLIKRIYGDANEDLYLKICNVLKKSFIQRSDELKKQDLERELKPDWLMSEKWAGMMLYLDHFSGNLKKFQEKIPYLEELGINWVHMMPVFKMPEKENDGGYAVSNYRIIDPRYGNWDDIHKITKEFRKKGMLLVLDLVLNHTSNRHDWAKKARKGVKKYQEFYYIFDNPKIPDEFEKSMPEVFPGNAPGNFTFDKKMRKWVMTVFHPYQWDLNYRNPEVFLEMLKNILFLANHGVDIIRLDAVPFLWKQIGTSGQNLPEAHDILKLFKICCSIPAPGISFISEAIVSPEELVRYLGGDDREPECDIGYNATFMALIWEALATSDTNLTYQVIQKLQKKPPNTTWINYLRSHDDIGLGFDDEDIYSIGKDAGAHRKYIIDYYTGKFPGSNASGAPFMYNQKTGDARISGTLASLSGLEKAVEMNDNEAIDLALRKITMMYSLIMSVGGLPLIYSGDEIGTFNDFSYLEIPERTADNRWMHRPEFNWKKAAERKSKNSVEHRIFSNLQKLIRIRKKSPEFADEQNISFEYCENEHLLAFLRWKADYKTLVICNFSGTKQAIKKELIARHSIRNAIDKFTGKPPEFEDNNLVLPPYGFYWLTDK